MFRFFVVVHRCHCLFPHFVFVFHLSMILNSINSEYKIVLKMKSYLRLDLLERLLRINHHLRLKNMTQIGNMRERLTYQTLRRLLHLHFLRNFLHHHHRLQMYHCTKLSNRFYYHPKEYSCMHSL